MVLQSISQRGIVLKDSAGTHYNVPSYGQIEVLDSLLNDSEFLRWLRARIRDLIVITAKIPSLVNTTEFDSITPFHGNEVYLEVASGVRWHFFYNANSLSINKWEFLGGPPLRHEINTAEEIATDGDWSNLDTDGPTITAPRDGDYDAHLTLVSLHTSATCNAQATIQVGNADGTAPLIVNEGIDVSLTGAVTKRLTSVTASSTIKARYYSDTIGELPTFSNRVLEVRPVRIL